MWPFDGSSYRDHRIATDAARRALHQEHKKPECRCGKSDDDAVLIELIKLFSTFITEVKKMSASTDALKASIAVVDGKLDLLIAKPPVVIADPEADAAVVEATAAVDAMGAKIDAAMAPAV